MITRARLRELLSYDPVTGIFVWCGHWYCNEAGEIAGIPLSNGYIKVTLDGHQYYAHRLAWLYVYGQWPARLDHKDTDRANNRICNLRQATNSQNGANQSLRLENKSGFKGVCWHKRASKWVAQITHQGKPHYLGLFEDPKQAHEAYMAEASRLFGEFARAA